MKRILFLFICFSFCCLKAQTTEEAIQFLKVNSYTWACEQIAYGTLQERLEISLEDNNKTLFIKEKMPDYVGRPGGYAIIRINLSFVSQVDFTSGSNCSGINIQTKANGIEMNWYSNDGEIIKNNEYWQGYFSKKGWVVDSIRVKALSDSGKGPSRIVNAIKFLAERNGAELTNSSF